MQFVTIEEVRQHCKADSGDDAMLTIYGEGAEAAAVAFLNRNVYVDNAALVAALAAVDMTSIHSAYEDAIEAADALDSDLDKQFAIDAAGIALRSAQVDASFVLEGMVITKNIKSAILLIVGHLYRNRETVVAGQSASAVEVPMSAQWLMSPYRKIGPL